MDTTNETRSDDPLATHYVAHVATMTARFAEALDAVGAEGVCIFAGPQAGVARDDAVYPYRTEPYFKAWLPLTGAIGSALAIRPGLKPVLVYQQPEDFWHAPPGDPSGYWTEHFDIRIARTAGEVSDALGAFARGYPAIGNPGESAAIFSSVDDPELLAHLDFLRAVKTPYEVLCLQGASEAAVRGHRAAQKAFAEGASEFALHQVFCSAAGQRETELPYGAIVALDRHAAILHYQHLEHDTGTPGESFLIDAGTECNGYAADVTRTWARHDGEFRELISSMDALQQQLCSEVSAGVDFVALHERAHELLAHVLFEHGIVRCSAAEAFEHGITRLFLPHGLGHLLGLQVHDAGGRQVDIAGRERAPPAQHPYLRLTRVLSEGFVVTIEPGLYFIPSLLGSASSADRRRLGWDAIERLMPFGGIRVEDDVVVDTGGCRNLTREAFRAA